MPRRDEHVCGPSCRSATAAAPPTVNVNSADRAEDRPAAVVRDVIGAVVLACAMSSSEAWAMDHATDRRRSCLVRRSERRFADAVCSAGLLRRGFVVAVESIAKASSCRRRPAASGRR